MYRATSAPLTADGELIEEIKLRIGSTETRPERVAQEDQALVNLCFWGGKQRIFFDANRRLIDATTSMDPEEYAYQANMIRGLVNDAVARVMAVNAEYRACPESGNIKDLENARTTDELFEHIRGTTDFDRARLLGTKWAAITGIGWLKHSWDPFAGEPQRWYKLDGRTKAVVLEELLPEEERQQKEAAGLFEDYAEGDLRTEVLSPFSVKYDSSARDGGVGDCRWIAQDQFVDIEVIAERWNMLEKDIPAMDPNASQRNLEDAIAFMSAGQGMPHWGWNQPRDKQRKRTRYTEMWERPCRKYPRGRRIAVAGGVVLNRNRMGGHDNPYAADRSSWAHLPFTKIDWDQSPGRFWGDSLVQDLLSAQFFLNFSRTVKAEFMGIHGLPHTFIGEQSGLDPQNMTKGGGEIYTVKETSNYKVQYGPVPQMPPDVAAFGGDCERDLKSIAAGNNADATKLPGQMRSGAAIRAMDETRLMPLTLPAKSNVVAVRDSGRTLIAIGKLKFTDERVLRYLGGDNVWIAKNFRGMNLVTDIRVVGEPGVTDTLNAKRAEVMDMVNGGVFNPQIDEETRTLILSSMEYNTSEEFMQRKLASKRSQEREIREMIATPQKWIGRGYPVLKWENHEVEARECVAFMYTEEYRQLDPDRQALIAQHWEQHMAFVQQKLEADMRMQALLKGTPGEKGQASQPAA